MSIVDCLKNTLNEQKKPQITVFKKRETGNDFTNKIHCRCCGRVLKYKIKKKISQNFFFCLIIPNLM